VSTLHVSNDEKLTRLEKEQASVLTRRERQWPVFDVRLNYRAEDARIGATEEIEHIIERCHRAGYALDHIATFEIPLGGAQPNRVHALLVFHSTY
jgi:hypothetical protein